MVSTTADKPDASTRVHARQARSAKKRPTRVPATSQNRSKYTPAVVNRICKGLGLGLTRELAAAYGGIGRSTFYEWIDEKPEFAERLEKVEAEAAAHWLDQIEASAEVDWRAAAWRLERRHPQLYGQQPVKHEVSGPSGNPIGVRFVDASAILARITAGSEADN